MFENFLDPVFRPLLNLSFFWSILIISFMLTLLITLVYKYATDQHLMKKLKSEMKSLQNELKKFKNDPKKAMAHQKKIMEKNMEYMKHSFKPTLYTFIPIIIIFGWLNAHMAYLPIESGVEFMVSASFKPGTFGEASLEVFPEENITLISNQIQEIEDGKIFWKLIGDEGQYRLEFTFNSRKYEKKLLITNTQNYEKPIEILKNSDISKLEIHNSPVKPLGTFKIFGWSPGWIGTYILFSLLFSTVLRKLLKIS
ncbi:MAG: EMC3/TMCO1 family protein [Nanoarchaeota archaeon]|nr:DUF106 domain-containing protein [Nanoarchaeota archaeon]MBU1030531.1 DUF106 domain-containing protein [Nanoarchaeota archaeon]MBU1849491.1 DUF106 domain-containing protein [Nanoarchaeota archaeon]